MAKKVDNAKKVFNILGFQYKPLEKRLLKDMPELKAMYESMSYSKKIKALDMYAQQVLGL